MPSKTKNSRLNILVKSSASDSVGQKKSPSAIKIESLRTTLRSGVNNSQVEATSSGSGRGNSMDGSTSLISSNNFQRNERNNNLPSPRDRTLEIWVKLEQGFKTKIEMLETDLSRRQESYIRRKRAYEEEIMGLSSQLEKAQNTRNKEMDGVEQISRLRGIHKGVLENINHVKTRTGKILQEQERDLLRAFRARLFDVQAELEREKKRNDSGSSYWIEKNNALEKDLEWTKEIADKLERMNRGLKTDNAHLKKQFREQEDDRELLIRQLVAVKKDNTRLRQNIETANEALSSVERENSRISKANDMILMSNTGLKSSPDASKDTENMKLRAAESGLPTPLPLGAEKKYKGTIKRLKKLLEAERKNSRKIKLVYANEIQNRTELELFLRQCIDDVKFEISKRRKQMDTAGGASHQSTGPNMKHVTNGLKGIHLSELTAVDRERVMELLLSQERVIELLYQKTFLREGGRNYEQRISTSTGESDRGDLGVDAGSSSTSPTNRPIVSDTELDDLFSDSLS